MKNCFLLLIVVFANVGMALAQDSATAPEASVITVGSVGKIDPKAKSVTLILATSITVQPPTEDPKTEGRGGRGGGRGGGGGGSRGGGNGQSRGAATGSGNTTGGRIAAPTLKNYKVMISLTTVLKEGDKEIRFEDLNVGDALQVMSANSNSKLDAIEVKRIPRDAPNSR